MLVRRWAPGNLGAFRFSGEDFEAVSPDLPRPAATELRLYQLVRAIELIRIDDVAADRVRHEVGDLQSGRIVLLVHEADIEVWHLAYLIAAVRDASKFELQLHVLRSATTFHHYMVELVLLASLADPTLQSLHTKR